MAERTYRRLSRTHPKWHSWVLRYLIVPTIAYAAGRALMRPAARRFYGRVLAALGKEFHWSGLSVVAKASLALLLFMVAYTLTVCMVKTKNLRKAQTSSKQFVPLLAERLRHQDIERAVQVSREFAEQGSHMAELVHRALLALAHCRENGTPDSNTNAVVREILDQNTSSQVYEVKSHLGLIDAIGRTSPFVGAAVGNPVAFSFGTLLAIAALWFATYIRRQSERIETELRHASSEVKEFLIMRHGKCLVCGKVASDMHLQDKSVKQFERRALICAECCPVCVKGRREPILPNV